LTDNLLVEIIPSLIKAIDTGLLVTANSGLSFWAGRLSHKIEKVFCPMYPTKKDKSNSQPSAPFSDVWEIVENDFLSIQ